jgi:tRNA G46 methylase TrmB
MGKKILFQEYKKIIEIGSNDGTLLKNFKSSNTEILGIEPSKNVALVAKKKKLIQLISFFHIKLLFLLKNLKIRQI